MARYDLILRDAKIFDGMGNMPFEGDVAVRKDCIVAVGTVAGSGKLEMDLKGLSVAPGFIAVFASFPSCTSAL